MDLFDIFGEAQTPPDESLDRHGRLMIELRKLAEHHGVTPTESFLDDLATTFIDPPPWDPFM